MTLEIAHIDDNEDEYIILNRLLNNHKITPYACYQDYLKTSNNYDFIICDLNMPDYSFQNLQDAAEKSDSPFVLYSNSPLACFNKSNIKYMESFGLVDFFEKGNDDQKLMKFINNFDENR